MFFAILTPNFSAFIAPLRHIPAPCPDSFKSAFSNIKFLVAVRILAGELNYAQLTYNCFDFLFTEPTACYSYRVFNDSEFMYLTAAFSSLIQLE